ncbi:1-acyl-sn-glycerol-3-phosphate acyltransferase [Owenweeksia hongkongensis]|uniref:1-acyl-sn-glycerol-3-phosphate acyltransferase n=1 Tax=Owenweeksia hongkongensis TaxID=253245 RepID=UPI003A918484
MSTPQKYIDINEVIKSKSERLAKWLPSFVVRYIKRIVHEDEVNEVMRNTGHLQGLEFVNAVMNELEMTIELVGGENIPKTGGCILAANHPLGGLDGIAFMQAVGQVRADMKFLVNDILLNIKNFQPLFLPVNKHGSNAREALNMIDQAYASDEATLVFPAGLVSRKLPEGIADLEWKKSFISKSTKYKKDIIPVHIGGRNSNFFYNLSNIRRKLGIKANLEMFYLADELFKQKGKTLKVTVGKPIPYTTFNKDKTQQEWADEVRRHVYQLANGNN